MPVKTVSVTYGLASGVSIASVTAFLNSPFVIALMSGILSASGVIIAARIAANGQRETREKLKTHGKALDSLMAGQFLHLQHDDTEHLLEGGGFPLETDITYEELQHRKDKEQDADSSKD